MSLPMTDDPVLIIESLYAGCSDWTGVVRDDSTGMGGR